MASTPVTNPALPDSAERSIEILLSPYLTAESSARARLSETDVRHVSTGLSRMGKDSWSKVPRVYAVLRMINHVQVIDSFLAQGISDIWFPFSHKTLPESLRSPSARFEFLRLQDVVLTKAFDLEREDGKHRHFSRSEDIPLQKVEELGKGGFGYVDRVVSTITYREYARKLIPRGKTFRKNAQVLRDFERELGHLKKMSHIHIVELVGSYTDPKFLGILMLPVADYNLKDFLARTNLTPGERSFLRTFFGCLASALCYLHENRIRHKDIKPQNVLVKGHQVFLTDFGISLDWSELDQSTTTGVTTKTPRYCAPEVAGFLPRNSLSDLWSLGCVFLEIWTVLKGETPDAISRYLEKEGSKSTCYCLNYESSLEWCTVLERGIRHPDDNPPLAWIRGMLQPDQEQRWSAQKLVDSIQQTNDRTDLRFAFSGTCCDVADRSTDSGHTSKRSSALLEETGASSVGVYMPRCYEVKSDEDTEVPAFEPSSSLAVGHTMYPTLQEPHSNSNEPMEATLPSLLAPLEKTEQSLGRGARPSTPSEELNHDSQPPTGATSTYMVNPTTVPYHIRTHDQYEGPVISESSPLASVSTAAPLSEARKAKQASHASSRSDAKLDSAPRDFQSFQESGSSGSLRIEPPAEGDPDMRLLTGISQRRTHNFGVRSSSAGMEYLYFDIYWSDDDWSSYVIRPVSPTTTTIDIFTKLASEGIGQDGRRFISSQLSRLPHSHPVWLDEILVDLNKQVSGDSLWDMVHIEVQDSGTTKKATSAKSWSVFVVVARAINPQPRRDQLQGGTGSSPSSYGHKQSSLHSHDDPFDAGDEGPPPTETKLQKDDARSRPTSVSSDSSLTSVLRPALTQQPSPTDRWAQIRRNAAERAARQSEEQTARSKTGIRTDHDESSGEETIESRVARIKALVSSLTGDVEETSSVTNHSRPDSDPQSPSVTATNSKSSEFDHRGIPINQSKEPKTQKGFFQRVRQALHSPELPAKEVAIGTNWPQRRESPKGTRRRTWEFRRLPVFVVAIHNCTPIFASPRLKLLKGDIIKVLGQHDDWLDGVRNDGFGLVRGWFSYRDVVETRDRKLLIFRGWENYLSGIHESTSIVDLKAPEERRPIRKRKLPRRVEVESDRLATREG